MTLIKIKPDFVTLLIKWTLLFHCCACFLRGFFKISTWTSKIYTIEILAEFASSGHTIYSLYNCHSIVITLDCRIWILGENLLLAFLSLGNTSFTIITLKDILLGSKMYESSALKTIVVCSAYYVLDFHHYWVFFTYNWKTVFMPNIFHRW